MEHMQIIRQKLRSTKQHIPLYLQNLETEGMDIVQEVKCEEVYIQILDVTRMNGMVYTDLTGAFRRRLKEETNIYIDSIQL